MFEQVSKYCVFFIINDLYNLGYTNCTNMTGDGFFGSSLSFVFTIYLNNLYIGEDGKAAEITELPAEFY